MFFVLCIVGLVYVKNKHLGHNFMTQLCINIHLQKTCLTKLRIDYCVNSIRFFTQNAFADAAQEIFRL